MIKLVLFHFVLGGGGWWRFVLQVSGLLRVYVLP